MYYQKERESVLEAKIIGDKRIYILMGDPSLMCTMRPASFKNVDTVASTKRKHTITLTTQHDDKPLYTGPLKLHIDFYFHIPQKPNARKLGVRPGDPHLEHPTILNCSRYLEDVCKNVIFKDNATIYCFEATKRYDFNPRAEFYFTEISCGN